MCVYTQVCVRVCVKERERERGGERERESETAKIENARKLIEGLLSR